MATYAYQVTGVRALGDDEYAVVSVLWTVQYLAFAVLLYPIEGVFAAEAPARWRTCLWWTAAVVGFVVVALWTGRRELLGGQGWLALVGGAIVLSYGSFSIVRGRFVAAGDPVGYATLTGGEALVRLLLTPLVLTASRSGAAVALLLPVGPPLMILLLGIERRCKPRRRRQVAPAVVPGIAGPLPGPPDGSAGSAALLAASTTANAGAQLVLASGPLLVPVLGGSPREVTVAFVTLTAARLPVFLALGGLLSQRLPVLIELRRSRDDRHLVRLARRTAAGGALVATTAAGFAAWLLPGLLARLMGPEVRPSALVAALVSGGVVLAVAALLVNQIVTVVGEVRRLVIPWLVAIGAVAALLALMPGGALLRVGSALVLGEAIGLIGLVLSSGGGRRSLANLRQRSKR